MQSRRDVTAQYFRIRLKSCAACAAYMKTALNIPPQDIEKICLDYYTNYGTTMAGLVVRPAFLTPLCADLLLRIPLLRGRSPER